MEDFTPSEERMVSAALDRLKATYKGLLKPSEGEDSVDPEALKEPCQKQLDLIESARSKLVSSTESGVDSRDVYLYVYVPDNIRDRELEQKLKEHIPESPSDERDSIFWSDKYNNFVTKAEHADLAEKAVRERYGESANIDRDPDFATKPNTWQVSG